MLPITLEAPTEELCRLSWGRTSSPAGPETPHHHGPDLEAMLLDPLSPTATSSGQKSAIAARHYSDSEFNGHAEVSGTGHT